MGGGKSFADDLNGNGVLFVSNMLGLGGLPLETWM
ncbi:hypothetical protein C343_00988 [Cryptococcus neoformans C23]|nr:hypothetical protein C343_00988 [Cryptococcus neoformans var. grubii C23]OWZ52448.1 hypothetical protein C353_01000 [Cryptococcus neoformans var. grubii AD1-83a]OXB39221.1 hypothetical protein J007_00985 [Cryptococcus neoformans var. grubii]OXH17267.1 hypothetical protein J010_00960 [Cryptococcus neoformans var. grubii]OXH17346.1 hypothetical protein J010_00959 [Cryptococcus neoformans var. grubii]